MLPDIDIVEGSIEIEDQDWLVLLNGFGRNVYTFYYDPCS